MEKSCRLAVAVKRMVQYNDPGLLRLLIQYSALKQVDKNLDLLTLALENDALSASP